MLKGFGIGVLVTTIVLLAIHSYLTDPITVQERPLELIGGSTDTLYLPGDTIIVERERRSQGAVNVKKRANSDSTVAVIDTVVVTPEGGLISVRSEDAIRLPLHISWDIPVKSYDISRVDTIKIIDSIYVSVPEIKPWYSKFEYGFGAGVLFTGAVVYLLKEK